MQGLNLDCQFHRQRVQKSQLRKGGGVISLLFYPAICSGEVRVALIFFIRCSIIENKSSGWEMQLSDRVLEDLGSSLSTSNKNLN